MNISLKYKPVRTSTYMHVKVGLPAPNVSKKETTLLSIQNYKWVQNFTFIFVMQFSVCSNTSQLLGLILTPVVCSPRKKQVLYIICLSMLDLVVDMLRALIDAMYFKIAFNIFFTLRQVDFYSESKKKETIFGNLSIITSQNSCLNDIMTILN